MAKNEKEGLRAQILRAARKLLIKEGVKDVSMRKIASSIGYTATSIYYHFKNKDELIHALIDEGHERLYRTNQAAIAALPEDASPLDRIDSNMRTFVKFGLENPEFYEIMYMTQSEEFAKYPKENFRKTRRNIDLGAQIYSEAQKAGLVRDREPRLSTATIGAMLHGYVSWVLMHRIDTRFDHNKLLEDILDVIKNGIVVKQ